MDPNNLQNLLSAMNQPQSAAPAAMYGDQSQQQQAAIATLQQNPGLAGYLQQQQQAQAAQPGGAAAAGGSVNMQEILARLGNYQR